MSKVIYKKNTWALKLFISFHAISILFKLANWPYITTLVLLPAVVLLVFYPLRYKAKKTKNFLDDLKMIWVIVHCIRIIILPQEVFALVLVESLLFFIWFVSEGFFYFDYNFSFWKQKEIDTQLLDVEISKPTISKGVYIVDYLLLLAVLFIISSSLIKIMHFPFALESSIIGYSLFAIILWFKKF